MGGLEVSRPGLCVTSMKSPVPCVLPSFSSPSWHLVFILMFVQWLMPLQATRTESKQEKRDRSCSLPLVLICLGRQVLFRDFCLHLVDQKCETWPSKCPGGWELEHLAVHYYSGIPNYNCMPRVGINHVLARLGWFTWQS